MLKEEEMSLQNVLTIIIMLDVNCRHKVTTIDVPIILGTISRAYTVYSKIAGFSSIRFRSLTGFTILVIECSLKEVECLLEICASLNLLVHVPNDRWLSKQTNKNWQKDQFKTLSDHHLA